MINEMALDAVMSDMLVLDRIKLMDKKEQTLALSEAFNLSEKLTKRIVEQGLHISLIEASTLINDQADSLASITTLRRASTSTKDHYLIKKMVEKYEILIHLFAHNLNPYSQQNVLKELDVSRRSAYAIKDVLQEQIAEKVKTIESESSGSDVISGKTAKQYILDKTISNLEPLFMNMEKGLWFNNVRLLIEVSRTTQQPLNKISPEIVESILNTTMTVQQ